MPVRRWLVAGIMLLMPLAAVPWGLSSAQSAPDPAVFALSPQDLPPGSQVVDSRVATNFDVSANYLQIGPAFPDGRLTGYYLQARAYDPGGHVRLVTSYLVSIFQTLGQAGEALFNQNDYWQQLGKSAPVQSLPFDANAYGDPGQARWYSVTDSNQHTHSELFFRRGPDFVELDLDSPQSQPTTADTQAFLAMAQKLDGLASGRLIPTASPTATSAPTPRPTATSTRTPTATPRPRPAATRKPTTTPTVASIKPVRESRQCKKGYRRVRGKCQKKG